MRHLMLVASATLAVTAMLALPAQAATPSVAAGKALTYLGTQQQSDGSIDGALGETADYTLGAKFHGLDPNNLKAGSGKSVYDFFASWVSASVACTNHSNTRDGNSIGKLVEAVVAGAHDPTTFGGRNLLADLEGAGGTTGGSYDATTGVYQDCASGGLNAVYAQANAILALEVANDATYPVPAKALANLRSLQSTTGGWPTFGQDNTNATALALMALAPLQNTCTTVDPVLTGAFKFLHSQQDPASGGMFYSNIGAFASTASDPDSDALVIQALVDVGEDPGAATWSNSKGSPASDVLTFQDPASGGISFDHASSADAFTTSQVPAGLDRAPFPDGAADTATLVCPTPSPSPSAATLASSAPATPALPKAGLAGLRAQGPNFGYLAWLLAIASVMGALFSWSGRIRREN
ncbi:MAG TPA: hypothetical protein VNV65_05150 [Candidatus Solibacter sp.]|jgi:hypothetical protein|nr:hypothetical protein [Candidatus Solibacter sp.]